METWRVAWKTKTWRNISLKEKGGVTKVKQPDPIIGGFTEYKNLVETHLMNNNSKCLTHEECHLDSFYPGKIYRKMKMKRNENGLLELVDVV